MRACSSAQPRRWRGAFARRADRASYRLAIDPLGMGPLARCGRSLVTALHAQRQLGAAGGTRPGFGVRWSSLRADCAAMLAPGSRRITRCVRFALCARTDAASRFTKRAGARRPRSCASRHLSTHPGRVPPAALPPAAAFESNTTGGAGKGARGQAAARMGGAEHRRARGRARIRALRRPTRRVCPSAESAANEASYATGRETEKRRGVGAQRRPPRISAAACPHAPLLARKQGCEPTHSPPQRSIANGNQTITGSGSSRMPKRP